MSEPSAKSLPQTSFEDCLKAGEHARLYTVDGVLICAICGKKGLKADGSL